MLREPVFKNILRDRALGHVLRVDEVRVHRLRVLDIVGEGLLLRVKRLRRLAAKDDLLGDERREELVEVPRNLGLVRPRIHGADVRENLGLLHRLPCDPAEEDLGVREHLVVGADAPQDVGERPELPDEGVFGKSK